MRIFMLAFTLLLISVSCNDVATVKGQNQAPAVGSKTTDELSKISGLWAKYWTAKQLDSVLDLYADDAVFLTGSGERITGKPAIRSLIKLAFTANSSVISARSIGTEQSGTLAYDSGDYKETLTTEDGAKRDLQGNYIIVFRQQKDGKWLIVQHMWSDKPQN